MHVCPVISIVKYTRVNVFRHFLSTQIRISTTSENNSWTWCFEYSPTVSVFKIQYYFRIYFLYTFYFTLRSFTTDTNIQSCILCTGCVANIISRAPHIYCACVLFFFLVVTFIIIFIIIILYKHTICH